MSYQPTIKLMSRFNGFFRDESANTGVEYALMVAGIAVTILVTLLTIGDSLVPIFTTVQGQIAEASPGN